MPRPVSLWLILLLGVYLYYRHWEGSFSFWPISFSFWEIPYLRKLAWSDLLLLPWGGAIIVALRSRSKGDIRSQEEHRGVMSVPAQANVSSQAIDTDEAMLSSEEDWLGLSGLAQVLHQNIKELDLSKSSLTVGVIAPWGKGKSSFMNLLKERLEKEKAIIISFNSRASKSVSSIQEDFFDAFAEELSRHYFGFGLLLARYTKHLGLLDQYQWTRPIGSLLTLILPGKEQEAVNRTLRKLGRRVYVIIDDLDRLSGEEILEVLKLIDRNASFSNTVFITAYDKAYVDNVLKNCLDHGLSHSFIDKYISMEVPLPEPTKERMKELAWLFMSTRIKMSSSAMYRQIYEAWNRVAGIVVASLDSVRDLKRYLNQILPRYNELINDRIESGNLVYEDYLLLHLLCYKDLTVYVALSSRRILRLDPLNRCYILAPNFEGELKQISQWEGSRDILKTLFDPIMEERGEELSCKPLRSQEGFDRYFRTYSTMDQSDPIEILLRIIRSTQMQAPNEEIDDMIKELGIGGVAWVLLKLIGDPCVGRENRAITIKLVAYVVYRYTPAPDPMDFLNLLHRELIGLFTRRMYLKYKDLGIVQNISEYKRLLLPMIFYVVHTQPIRTASIIDNVMPMKRWFDRKYIYSVREVAKVLLKCQTNYYRTWIPSFTSCERARSFVLKKYMKGDPDYIENATQSLISLIQKYPDECVWMALVIETNQMSGYFTLDIQTRLLGVLEKWGFSLGIWLNLIRDPRVKYILNYVESLPERGGIVLVAPLPDEEVDLGNLDSIYRIILAYEKWKSQSANQ